MKKINLSQNAQFCIRLICSFHFCAMENEKKSMYGEVINKTFAQFAVLNAPVSNVTLQHYVMFPHH